MLSDLVHNSEFWVAIAFLVVVVVAWRPMQRRLAVMLDERAASIKRELDQAERLRRDAESALADYRRKQAQALQQADAIVALAREEAEKAAERAKADLMLALERGKRTGADRIALDERKAAADVRNIAADIAVEAARRLLAGLDPGRREQLLDDSVKALARQLTH